MAPDVRASTVCPRGHLRDGLGLTVGVPGLRAATTTTRAVEAFFKRMTTIASA